MDALSLHGRHLQRMVGRIAGAVEEIREGRPCRALVAPKYFPIGVEMLSVGEKPDRCPRCSDVPEFYEGTWISAHAMTTWMNRATSDHGVLVVRSSYHVSPVFQWLAV